MFSKYLYFVLISVLVIDPENKTCGEFQIAIKEKLRQGMND